MDKKIAKKKTSQSSPLKGFVVIALIKFLSLLPLSVGRALSRLGAYLMYIVGSDSRFVTEINLKLCFPEKSAEQRKVLTQKSMLASTQLLFEITKIWLQAPEKSLQMINKVVGEDVLENVLNDDTRGVLIVSPHVGNWELLYTYLAKNHQLAGLYRPPKLIELEPIILEGRERAGGKLIRTSQMEVRKMLKLLKSSGGLFLLPDQQPPLGSGVFAPFYGQDAYTMTLLQGLAKRTNAHLLIASCIREADGFKLEFKTLTINVELDESEFAGQLNRAMEEVINEDPAQYEWAYKRFKSLEKGVTDIYKKI